MSDPFDGLAPCVHCGFCLQSCPTFLATGDEADSPRGRIVLMQRFAGGELPATDEGLTTHLDRCLGCRACEPACPSGVAYGPALEEARRRITSSRSVPVLARAILTVMREPTLRKPALTLARLFRPMARRFAGRGRVGFALGMLAGTAAPPYGTRGTHRRVNRPSAGRPAVVFEGCIQRELFAHVNRATERTLGANGYAVRAVPDQQCCGALHAHSGLLDDALRLARRNVEAFAAEAAAAIVVNAAGCGAMLKDYERLLGDEPLAGAAQAFSRRVVDISQALAAAGPARGAALDVTVAYDPPCHLVHAQRVVEEPFAVFDAVPGLRVVPHEEPDQCCGSAGIYSLMEPELSRAVLDRKITALRASRPDVVATGNPGCIMQLTAGLRAAGSRTPVVHPVQLLDRSYERAGMYESRLDSLTG